MDQRHGGRGRLGRLAIAVSGAVLSAAAVAAPAAATGQPVIERGIVDGPHIDVIDCGSFTATLVRTFVAIDHATFDASGNLVRDQVNAQMTGSLTSSTGLVVPLSGSVRVLFDATTGSLTFDGRVFMGTRRGSGEVVQDTGRYVVAADDTVLQDAGPHDVEDDPTIFCTALQ